MSDLVLSKVNKHYGDFHAVKNINLTIESGGFTVLVGPSGCGKSTLLRSIAGLEQITDGDVSMGEASIKDLAPRDRNLAMVFQSYALYPFLSVYENIAFGLRARKVPAAEIATKVEEAGELLGLTDYFERKPRELSGGQRQRVAIGRAIVRDAELFLFDEPLSNLDAKLRDEMREELKKLHQRLGKTFVYVTHDQIEAMTLADQIVLLRDGEIVQNGPPMELFNQPKNLFVASFLGSPSMNLIEVSVPNDKNEMVLPDGQVLEIDQSRHDKLSKNGGKIIWGIRPEHFEISGEQQGTLSCEIDVFQPTGSQMLVSFRLKDTHVLAELPTHSVDNSQTKMRLVPDMSRTHFFSADTGDRID